MLQSATPSSSFSKTVHQRAGHASFRLLELKVSLFSQKAAKEQKNIKIEYKKNT